MLSFLPVLGPILQGLIGPLFTGVSDILGKYWGSKVETLKVDADVVKTEAVESTKIIDITEKDWGVRLARDLIIFPVAVHVGLYVWDRTVDIRHPDWVWGVRPLDYLPFLVGAVLTFLLGNVAMNTWKRHG